MWLLISGVIILFVASFLHSYCTIGVQASPLIAPAIFYSHAGTFLQIGWIVLFVIGGVMLFIVNWIVGIVAILVYWFLLPLLVAPIVKKWMQGSWDDDKHILEERGYTLSY